MPKMLSPSFAPRRASGYIRYALVLVLVFFVYYTFVRGPSSDTDADFLRPQADLDDSYFQSSPPNTGSSDNSAKPPSNQKPNSAKPPSKTGSKSSSSTSSGPEGAHPIDKLIFDAQRTFAALTSKESKTLEEAAQAYRKRRGRHPPPGFDVWYNFAAANNALVIEDFFDQIYHDLQPFWGMNPALLRKEAVSFEMTINIRNHNASTASDWFWTTIWLDMIKTIEHMLPDMDLALNPMDEPRLVVPWEDVQGLMRNASKTVKLPKAKTVTSEFQKLPEPKQVEPDVKIQTKLWEDKSTFFGSRPFWSICSLHVLLTFSQSHTGLLYVGPAPLTALPRPPLSRSRSSSLLQSMSPRPRHTLTRDTFRTTPSLPNCATSLISRV